MLVTFILHTGILTELKSSQIPGLAWVIRRSTLQEFLCKKCHPINEVLCHSYHNSLTN